MLANQRKLYPLLFDCAAQSLLEFGRNRLGGDLGITAVLHTWGQKLDFHPHLHCIVTGGALSPDGKQWRSPKQRKFRFPVQAVAALFRGKFLAGLAQMLDAGAGHTAFFGSSAKPGLGHLDVIRAVYIGLMDLLARAQSYFSNLLLRSNPSLPQSALHRSRYFTHT
jgi:Putative transposase